MKEKVFSVILMIAFNSISQKVTTKTSWYLDDGTFTAIYKIIDGKRVLDGPFTFKRTGELTTTISGTYKNDKFEGPFNFSRSGMTYGGTTSSSAVGSFKNGNLDGLWSFKDDQMSYKITFKDGVFVKGEKVNSKTGFNQKISCDEFGLINGLEVFKHKDQYGAVVQDEIQWVHGIKVSKKTKDVTSGKYLGSQEFYKDTSIFNHANFNGKEFYFQKAGDEKKYSFTKVNCERSEYFYNWNASYDDGLGIVLHFLFSDFKNPCIFYE